MTGDEPSGETPGVGVTGLLTRTIRGYLPPGSGVLFSMGTRRRLLAVLLGSLVLSGLEILGMFLLLLMMRQLTTPGASLGALGQVPGLSSLSDEHLIVVIGGAVLAAFTVKSFLGFAFRRWVLVFVGQQQAETAHRLLIGYLRGPYQRVVDKNTAYFIRTMYDGTASVYGLVVGPVIQSAVELFTISALLVFLVIVMPTPALVAIVFFTTASWLLSALVRKHAERAGRTMVDSGVVAYRSTLHAIGGIKEIKVRRTHSHFLGEFKTARQESARAGATSALLAELPRFVLEWLFIVMVLLMLALLGVTADPDESLPLLAVFVATGVRLLPSATRLVGSASSIRTGLPQMEGVVADLVADLPVAQGVGAEDAEVSSKLAIREAVRADEVSFAYPNSDELVLDRVSIRIGAGESFAITGPSGSGKSTLVDIVLGLQPPSSGRVTVDGVPIDFDVGRWQRSIGLVPQDVFLLDDSLRNNVSMGLDGGDDDTRVMKALRSAQLEDLVAALPQGIDTPLGERGGRVSGGQRQRIGIARALFVEPAILVLDEATSALDNETERQISETLRSLHGTVTTLIVAHRLSTVRHCDAVMFLDGGRVVASGTFDELMASSAAFANLVALGRL